MICAICAAGIYCWLHDQAAIDDNHGSIVTPETDAQVLAFGIQQGMAAEVARQIRAEFGLDQVDCAPHAGGE